MYVAYSSSAQINGITHFQSNRAKDHRDEMRSLRKKHWVYMRKKLRMSELMPAHRRRGTCPQPVSCSKYMNRVKQNNGIDIQGV